MQEESIYILAPKHLQLDYAFWCFTCKCIEIIQIRNDCLGEKIPLLKALTNKIVRLDAKLPAFIKRKNIEGNNSTCFHGYWTRNQAKKKLECAKRIFGEDVFLEDPTREVMGDFLLSTLLLGNTLKKVCKGREETPWWVDSNNRLLDIHKVERDFFSFYSYVDGNKFKNANQK